MWKNAKEYKLQSDIAVVFLIYKYLRKRKIREENEGLSEISGLYLMLARICVLCNYSGYYYFIRSQHILGDYF